MQLANKVEEFLNIPIPKLTYSNTADVYFAVFGVRIKEGCGVCVDDARYRLLRWFKNQNKNMANTKYRFVKGKENVSVVYKISDERILINASNLTDYTAELILADEKRKHLIELAPKVEVKKAVEKKTIEPTLSTSIEVLTDGSELKESVKEVGLNTSESEHLTAKKKRGRPKLT